MIGDVFSESEVYVLHNSLSLNCGMNTYKNYLHIMNTGINMIRFRLESISLTNIPSSPLPQWPESRSNPPCPPGKVPIPSDSPLFAQVNSSHDQRYFNSYSSAFNR